VPHKCLSLSLSLTRTNVNPQQQQASGIAITANTRIYNAKRTRGTFQNRLDRADTYTYNYSSGSGSGAFKFTSTSIPTTHCHRFAGIQSVQTANHRCAAVSV
jgi:hypothetical protein